MEVNWLNEISSSSVGMTVYSGTHNERNVVVKVLPKDYGAFEHESSSIERKF